MDTSVSTELAPHSAGHHTSIIATIVLAILAVLTYCVVPNLRPADHEGEKRMRALEETVRELVTSVRELSDADEDHEKKLNEIKTDASNRLAVVEGLILGAREAREAEGEEMAEAIGRLFITLQELQRSVSHLAFVEMINSPPAEGREPQQGNRTRLSEISHNLTSSLATYDTLNGKITEYLREFPIKTVGDVFKHIRESDPNVTRHDINSRLYNLLNRGVVVKTICAADRLCWMLK